MTDATGKYGGRKTREGTVVSHSMEKTVVVSISSAIRHRLYKKTIRRNRNYVVHDEDGEAHKGDRVRIVESEPISKTKRWRLIEVLRQVDLPAVAPGEIDLEVIGEVKPKEEDAPTAVAPTPAAVDETPAGQPAAEAADEAAQPAQAEATEEIETPEEIEVPEEVKTAEDAPAEPEAPAAEEAEAPPEEAVAEEPKAAEEPTDEGKAE
ncbi:MAG: 30S ribosomal protein S17 [Chloroflexi bacterium]|nr:30S ribosomal protein S17 [Chloroflexota bacterium]